MSTLQNDGEHYYPEKRDVLFTFTFRNVAYVCLRETDANVCMRIRWDLWQGYFCPDEAVSDEILWICDRIFFASETSPARYPLRGEHYFISLSGEDRLKIAFAPKGMMRGPRYRVPTVLRLLFAALLSCVTCYFIFEKCLVWLAYLFPSLPVFGRMPQVLLYACAALGTALFFSLFGKSRSVFSLYLESWFPIGALILLGVMKKYPSAVWLLVLITVLSYGLFYWLTGGAARCKPFRPDWQSLKNAAISVVYVAAILVCSLHVTPYSTSTAEVSPELTARYEQACASLGRFQEMEPMEKLELLQVICDYECIARFGSTSPKVNIGVTDTENTLGFYAGATSTVTIRTEHLTNGTTEDVLTTLLHEARHHMQHRIAKLYLSLEPHIREEYKAMSPFREAVLYLENYNRYHDPSEDYELYYHQTIEADSRAWAEERMKYYLPFILGEAAQEAQNGA